MPVLFAEVINLTPLVVPRAAYRPVDIPRARGRSRPHLQCSEMLGLAGLTRDKREEVNTNMGLMPYDVRLSRARIRKITVQEMRRARRVEKYHVEVSELEA